MATAGARWVWLTGPAPQRAKGTAPVRGSRTGVPVLGPPSCVPGTVGRCAAEVRAGDVEKVLATLSHTSGRPPAGVPSRGPPGSRGLRLQRQKDLAVLTRDVMSSSL